MGHFSRTRPAGIGRDTTPEDVELLHTILTANGFGLKILRGVDEALLQAIAEDERMIEAAHADVGVLSPRRPAGAPAAIPERAGQTPARAAKNTVDA